MIKNNFNIDIHEILSTAHKSTRNNLFTNINNNL